MSVAAIQSEKFSAFNIAPEALAGNQSLSENQKISEASRQFEAMLLRQILSESQKPMIQSEFTDNSTSAGIYQDFITNQLSDSLSKSGAFGFAKVFERQLERHPEKISAESKNVSASQPTDRISTQAHE